MLLTASSGKKVSANQGTGEIRQMKVQDSECSVTVLPLQEMYSSLTKESGATLQNPAPPLTSSGSLNRVI